MDSTDIEELVKEFRLFAPGISDSFSDDEIEIFLSRSQWSLFRSLELFYLRLAGDAAEEEKSVKDEDLALDLRGRSKQYLALAMQWKDKADQEESEAGTNDIFEIFPVGLREPYYRRPELSPRPFGRC